MEMGPAWPGSFFLLPLARDAETRPAARRGFPATPATSRGVRPTGVISATRRIHPGKMQPRGRARLSGRPAAADGDLRSAASSWQKATGGEGEHGGEV